MPPDVRVNTCYYPESDGKPMGETDEHRDEMFRHIELLRHYFAGQRVYVSGNLLIYYEQGNPKKFVVPDAFVVKDVDPCRRRTYLIWMELRVPDVVIETTSRKTRRKDTGEKHQLYGRLGIKEYFLFDLLGEYLDPILQGYRLVSSEYVRIEEEPDESLLSDELGLRLRAQEGSLQFFRVNTGERLLTGAERADQEAESLRSVRMALEREAEALQRETEARRAAEAEVQRLREELTRRDAH